MFGRKAVSPTIEQAIVDFTRRGCVPIIKRTDVADNTVDVETAGELVRIQLDEAGRVMLLGRHRDGYYDEIKQTYNVMFGLWFAGFGWRYTSKTVTKGTYRSYQRRLLPRGA